MLTVVKIGRKNLIRLDCVVQTPSPCGEGYSEACNTTPPFHKLHGASPSGEA
jgi:hypothetical protein